MLRAWVYRRPWTDYHRPFRRMIFTAPAVVGGLSIPVAMYNYRRRRAK